MLASSAVGDDGQLSAEYTCDGSSASPPLEWNGSPDDVESFAVIMDHIAPDDEIHAYWTLWNIPADVDAIVSNEDVPGDIGVNTVNDRPEYAPPCSQGPGDKTYTLTLYALSGSPDLSDPDETTREMLLDAIDGLVIH